MPSQYPACALSVAKGAPERHRSPQERRGAVALLVPLAPQGVENGQRVVQLDRLSPRDRAAWMREAEGEPGVHVVRGAHALADRKGRLVDELAHYAAENEAGRIVDPLGDEAEPGEALLHRVGS